MVDACIKKNNLADEQWKWKLRKHSRASREKLDQMRTEHTFPSSHWRVSSPTDKQHLLLPFSGTTNGKCDVSTKFVKSLWGLMDDCGFMDAKKASTTGTLLLCMALEVMGNNLALILSH